MKKNDNLLARCIRTAGTLCAGVLLYRICYWYRYTKVRREGVFWVAKARSEWLEETTLTLKQYNTALTKLRTQKLVEVKQKQFGGRNLTFIRLLERAFIMQNLGGQCSLEGTPECVLEGSLQDHLGDKIKEFINSDYVFVNQTCAGDFEKKVDTGKPPEYQDQVKEDADMPTVQELLLSGGKTKKPKSLAKENCPKAADGWRDGLKGAYPGKFLPAFTGKHVGQFKQIDKHLPDAADAYHLMMVVIENWADFANKVKIDTGSHNVPAVPNLDFVLKHIGSAVDFGKKKEPKLQKKVEVPKETVKTTSVQLTAQKKPTHQKASKADLMDILGKSGEE